MYLRICMKTKFRQLHFRGRSTLHKIGEFYLSEHGRQPQFSQNAILARSKAKIRNWKIMNCFFIYMCQTLFTDKKMRENHFWSRSRVDHFQRDCHLNALSSANPTQLLQVSTEALSYALTVLPYTLKQPTNLKRQHHCIDTIDIQQFHSLVINYPQLL